MNKTLNSLESHTPVNGQDFISISEFSPSWTEQFLTESKTIRSSVSCTTLFVDHVGSTAIEGLAGKPIIDILISLNDWDLADTVATELENIGYQISERCEDTPRYFITKYSTDGSGCFHLHLCQPNSRWARDMIIFRDELSSDSNFSKSYVNLKKLLAKTYSKDPGSYMREKKIFIERRLREVESEFSVNKLLTHQLIESTKAEQFQIWMMISQLFISLLAAISVYLSNNKHLLTIAAITFLLMLAWLTLSRRQQRHRSSGDQARRAALLTSGLNMRFSAGQKLRISDDFSKPASDHRLRREENHFASRKSPGYVRLSEMIEESSYWMRDLQKASANLMSIVLTMLVIIMVIAGATAISSMDSDRLISLSRAMVAIMVFVVSSDALGLLLNYQSSASSIDEIFRRVESTAARGHEAADIMLLMSDYNAAIERAPSPLPYVYKLRQKELSARWKSYLEAKLSDEEPGCNTSLDTTSDAQSDTGHIATHKKNS